MDTGPTATLVGSEAHIRLQLELFDKAIELEKLKIKSKELDICSRTTNGLGVPTIPVTESCAVAPVALDRNVQPDSASSGCTSKSEQFGDWLRQDKNAKNAVLALGKSGRYNHETKNIHYTWKDAFVEGMEKLIGRLHVMTEEEKDAIERLRSKCNSPGWNFEIVYKMLFRNRDPVNLFTDPQPAQEKAEESLHTHFPLAKPVRLIGRKRNISSLASDDETLYYIGKGSVFCNGKRDSCCCSEGHVKVMVEELFPHDGPLQKFGGQCHEEITSRVISPADALEWRQSLLRHVLKEHVRTKTKPKGKQVSKQGGKENEVRKSTRKAIYSSKIVDILATGTDGSSKQTTVGAKRGRKRKVGAPVRTIEPTKPVTSVVERPGKRRTTKLALN